MTAPQSASLPPHPRIWWDGTDFLYLWADTTPRPGFYRAQTVEDVPSSEGPTVELVVDEMGFCDANERMGDALTAIGMALGLPRPGVDATWGAPEILARIEEDKVGDADTERAYCAMRDDVNNVLDQLVGRNCPPVEAESASSTLRRYLDRVADIVAAGDRLADELARVTRERDEARADVARLLADRNQLRDQRHAAINNLRADSALITAPQLAQIILMNLGATGE